MITTLQIILFFTTLSRINIVTGQDPTLTSTIWINEFHYDNDGTNTGEFVEIAGISGTDLSDYEVYLYNGATNTIYDDPLSSFNIATIPDEGDGIGTAFISLPSNGLQNGAPDGIALVYAPSSTVVQFLSYEGTFTASGGLADGMTSEDVGVTESSSTPIGSSVSLIGSGTAYDDFTWDVTTSETPGTINSNQFTGPVDPTSTCTSAIWTNEFHYDNTGTDTGEFVEIAGISGLDLDLYSIYLYNGADGAPYDGPLSFSVSTIPDEGSGIGTSFISTTGLQNGSPDGIALVYEPTSTVVQFLSYEGSITAVSGPADGITSEDVGVYEISFSPIESSVSLIGTGNEYSDFIWFVTTSETPGTINSDQLIFADTPIPTTATPTTATPTTVAPTTATPTTTSPTTATPTTTMPNTAQPTTSTLTTVVATILASDSSDDSSDDQMMSLMMSLMMSWMMSLMIAMWNEWNMLQQYLDTLMKITTELMMNIM